ncbi:MAG: hypothetical protein HKM95_06410 [Inquilinus sp.]|nr:hypothetical protein [Inquilinus sp.]
MISPPLPRYRIYTRTRDYPWIGFGLFGFAGADAFDRLEAQVADQFGGANCVPMPQNRVGIYFAVKALVRPGKKIVLSPYTLSDVVNMVVCAGAVPVFADIDRRTCNIDPAGIEALIDDDTDAVLITHLHGLLCDMAPIVELCRRRGVKLIEDAAQAFGSRQGTDSRYAGTFGDAGVFSFGMYKNITSFYGGMLVTPHTEVAETVRDWMRDLSYQALGLLLHKVATGIATDLATFPPVFRSFTYWLFRFAYLHDVGALNRQVTIESDPRLKTRVPDSYLCRMRPIQATIVRSQLPRVATDAAKRIRAAALYDEGLRDITEILLPPLRTDGSHIYTYYPIQTADRDRLLKHMIRSGRDTAVQHLRNCASLECFADWQRDCPNAELTASQVVLLPTYPRYSETEIQRNIASIRDYFGYPHR